MTLPVSLTRRELVWAGSITIASFLWATYQGWLHPLATILTWIIRLGRIFSLVYVGYSMAERWGMVERQAAGVGVAVGGAMLIWESVVGGIRWWGLIMGVIAAILLSLTGNIGIAWIWDTYSKRISRPASKSRHPYRRSPKILQPHPSRLPDPHTQANEFGSLDNSITSLLTSHGISDRISLNLRTVLHLICETFISNWYYRITPSPIFPLQIQHLIFMMILKFQSHVVQKTDEDLPRTLLVGKVIPILTRHFADYRKNEKYFSANNGGVDPVTILQAHYPNLHPALPLASLSNPIPTIHDHLRLVSTHLLEILLPETEKSNPLLVTFLRELLSVRILAMMVEYLSDPDVINRLMEDQADKYQRQRKEVSIMRAALDSPSPNPTNGDGGTPKTPQNKKRTSAEGFDATVKANVRNHGDGQRGEHPSPSRNNHHTPRTPPTISSETSAKDFDSYLRGIGKVKNQAEARRMKADIERDCRKYEKEIRELEARVRGGKNSAGNEKETRKKMAHVERLGLARQKVEKKIETMSGKDHLGSSFDSLDHRTTAHLLDGQITLRQILEDASANSFFFEWMERRKLSRQVQFWIAVDSFKDSLEVIGSDDDEDEEGEMTLGGHASQLWDERAVRTAEEDLRRIWTDYLDPEIPSNTLEIPSSLLNGIKTAVNEPEDASLQARRNDLRIGRANVVRAQRQIYETMEEDDYPAFRGSELYIQAATAISASLSRVTSPLSRTISPLAASPGLQKGTGIGISKLFPKFGSSRSSSVIKSGPTSPILTSENSPTHVSPHLLAPDALEERRTTADAQRRTSGGRLRGWSLTGSPIRRQERGIETQTSMESLLGPMGDGAAKSRDPLFADDEDGENQEDPLRYRHDSIDIGATEALVPITEDNEDDRRMAAIRLAMDTIFDRRPGEPQSAGLASRQVSEVPPDYTSRSSAASLHGDDFSEGNSPDHLSASVVSETVPRPRLTPLSRPSATPAIAATDLTTALSYSHKGSARVLELGDSRDVPADDPLHDSGDVMMAVKGELHLAVDIAEMGEKIDRLRDQEVTLEHAIHQADLQGEGAQRTDLLRKSLSDLQREVRALAFQRAQYERKETENRLVPSQTQISIPRFGEEMGDDGKMVHRYTIEIQQFSPDGARLQKWEVARRFNEFDQLNQAARQAPGLGDELRSKGIEMPGKKFGPMFPAPDIDRRRRRLERFLQDFVALPAACDFPPLLDFLCRRVPGLGDHHPMVAPIIGPRQIMRRTSASALNVKKTVIKTLSFPSLDSITADLAFRPVEALDALLSSIIGLGGATEVNEAALKEEVISATVPSATSFTGPICDLLIELFRLQDSNWFRKQGVIVMVQQFFGVTIQRKVRDSLKAAMSEKAVEGYLAAFQNAMWPDGNRRPPSAPRTKQEKSRTKAKVELKFETLVPDIIANPLGRDRARKATHTVFLALQVQLLNQHLILTILDEILIAIFPEIGPKLGRKRS